MIGISSSRPNQGTDQSYTLQKVEKAWLKISIEIKLLKTNFREN